MVGAVTKEESGVSKPEELNLGRPVDKRASLSDHNKGIKIFITRHDKPGVCLGEKQSTPQGLLEG